MHLYRSGKNGPGASYKSLRVFLVLGAAVAGVVFFVICNRAKASTVQQAKCYHPKDRPSEQYWRCPVRVGSFGGSIDLYRSGPQALAVRVRVKGQTRLPVSSLGVSGRLFGLNLCGHEVNRRFAALDRAAVGRTNGSWDKSVVLHLTCPGTFTLSTQLKLVSGKLKTLISVKVNFKVG